MNRTEFAHTMSSRASVYRFLSRMFEKEISGSLLTRLSQMTLPGGDLGEGAAMMAEFLAEKDASAQAELLAADYAKVFLGAGETNGNAAYPYQSVYTSEEGLIMQRAWQELKTLYHRDGLALSTDMADIKEDHIAVEFQYMAYLCEKARNGEDLKAQQVFVTQYLMNWAPEFLVDVEKYAQTNFYKGLARMTEAFLKNEAMRLNEMEGMSVQEAAYMLTIPQMDQVFAALREHYKIYAPKLLPRRGAQGKDLVRYQEVCSADEIVYDRPSDFSPKEVYYPVIQTMIRFSGAECRESELEDDKGLLIFMRPCDINGLRRLDQIFLKNGGTEDLYYKRLREKVRIVLMECSESYENCFCVSMGTNKTEQYDLAVRMGKEQLYVQVKNQEFMPFFAQETPAEYEPAFIQENARKVSVPQIPDVQTLQLVSSLEYWEQFDGNCIGCGGCNTVCPTCSCFDTIDVIYDETSREGERRRVWSSCMLDTFTMTAGGNRARKTAGANMRFKTLHKIYDYQKRFGGEENMCVGCGRCVSRCPKNISFPDTINGLSEALKQAKGDRK